MQAASNLTPRQEEIWGLLRRGMSNKMIAGVLGISEGTVKNHITEILRALNASNRTQAAQHNRTDMFDIEEYMHLALHANAAGDVHSCMRYLKEVLRQQSRNATAIYLLAVQHAQLGLLDRAVAGMQAALSIDPRLEIGRFQLGMLLLESRHLSQAKEQFAALSGSADLALRAYSEAMMALADDDQAMARDKLALGLRQKSSNRALGKSMRRVLDQLAKNAAAGGRDPADNPMFLGAYRDASS